MSEIKHTPGPWHVSEVYPHIVSDSHNMTICNVMQPVVVDPVRNITVHAGRNSELPNSHLIAAAPQLFSQVKKYINVLEVFLELERARPHVDVELCTALYENLCAAQATVKVALGEQVPEPAGGGKDA